MKGLVDKMEELLKYQKKIFDLEHTINVLDWDLRISTPTDEKDSVISLIAELESKLFKLKTSLKYGKILENAINSSEFKKLSLCEKRYVNAFYKDYQKIVRVPKDFYVKYVELIHKSTSIWEEAKEKNDYNLFKPFLEKIVEYTKKYYGFLNNGEDLYDTMLNSYEEGLTSKVIDKLFDELKNKLIPLINKLNNKEVTINMNVSKDTLIETAEFLLNYIGFDMNKGALGIYPHGFTEKIGNKDVRIAFKETNNALDFVSTIIHEGGHGILEQNVDANLTKYECTTCDGINALHESQSRFYENMLGRNINFWVPIYDDVKKMLGLDVDINEFVKGLNNPVCSLVRTEADELTYCMHIILRYEIERDLFSGKITVDDLPRVWNAKMKEYLGVEVSSDSEGIMQDVHWAEGDFGYFPSYLLGSIFDGMFLEKLEKDLGSIDEILKSGNIKKITKYLIDNIYVNGSAFTSVEVLKRLGINSLSVDPLVNYFYKKYDK